MAAPEVKAAIDVRPTERQLRAQEIAAEIIQQRYERWTRYQYTQIFAGMRRAIVELDHIPDDTELQTILARYRTVQESTLSRLFLNIYPQARDLVQTESDRKALRWMTETKEDGLTLEQQMLLQWISTNLRLSVEFINRTTLDLVEEIRLSSTDTVDFMRRLQDSGAFSQSRARMIAVTQTNQAVNSAISEAATQAARGRRMVKTWRTSGRTNVRDTHRMMRGVTIPADELYQVPRRDGGIDLMAYPGDTSHGASPGNIVNCHCKSFPRLAEYE